jgi:hypothetical protein
MNKRDRLPYYKPFKLLFIGSKTDFFVATFKGAGSSKIRERITGGKR